ncbi:MAG: hypothetical protein SFW07_02335 [Gammaproteobacteria bacterium]|nr:hypothetical protein [Gammaproteobacteria bacterium]
MTDYHKKLITLQKHRQKLIETEKFLIEKRKREIADLAEKFNLLTVDDKIINNYFAHFKDFRYEPSEKAADSPSHSSSTQPEICEAKNART